MSIDICSARLRPPQGKDILYADQRARRYARNLARNEGIVLGRFRKVPGSDDPNSLLGDEWFADEVCDRPGMSLVWRPVGESNMNEALRTCTVCRWFGKWFYGISVRGARNVEG